MGQTLHICNRCSHHHNFFFASTDYDCILHVNPYLEIRGLAMIFNPTTTSITRNITLLLYYTGISDKAIAMKEGGNPVDYTLNRDYTITISVTVAAKGITWYLIKDVNN